MTESRATRIDYSPEIAKHLRRLIVQADKLEELIDEEGYQAFPESRPAVKAALAVQAGPFTAWSSAALSFLQTICGSERHPMVKSFLHFVIERENVVDAVRRGRGVLEGFLSSWKAGTLWRLPDSAMEPGQPAHNVRVR